MPTANWRTDILRLTSSCILASHHVCCLIHAFASVFLGLKSKVEASGIRLRELLADVHYESEFLAILRVETRRASGGGSALLEAAKTVALRLFRDLLSGFLR